MERKNINVGDVVKIKKLVNVSPIQVKACGEPTYGDPVSLLAGQKVTVVQKFDDKKFFNDVRVNLADGSFANVSSKNLGRNV